MHEVKSPKPQFFILLLLVSFGSVGAVLFTPALPAIQQFFHISIGKTQLTITSYLVGYALGQLAYGPMANGLGRKKTLYLGLGLSVVGALLCVASAWIGSFAVLVLARFIQALGATAGLKISYTMVADTYEQAEATKMISRFILAFAIMPGIGITIGGWLTQLLSWEACFYFLALFGIVMLGLASRLPETAKSIDRSALKLPSILEGYRLKLKNKQLILSSFLVGCCTSIIYIFASKSPFIGINIIGLSPEVFGTYNLIPPIGMVLGSFLASALIGRFPVLNLIFGGIACSLLATLAMLIPFAIAAPSAASLFFPMVLIYLAQSTVYAHISSYGLASAKNKSNASAVLNFINISSAVVAVLLSEFVFPESAIALPLFFIFFFILMLLLWRRLKLLSSHAS
ncbi:MAG: MFS transporter [Verrucomicrobia bacterium]|nr:MFS transporter [Verrucomicrobiota bacterium]